MCLCTVASAPKPTQVLPGRTATRRNLCRFLPGSCNSSLRMALAQSSPWQHHHPVATTSSLETYPHLTISEAAPLILFQAEELSMHNRRVESETLEISFEFKAGRCQSREVPKQTSLKAAPQIT